MTQRRPIILLFLPLWLLLLAVAAPLDIPIAHAIAHAGWAKSLDWLWSILRWPGNFCFTLVIAAILLIFHAWKWRAAGLLCLCGIMSGLVTVLLKWFVGRTRPPKSDPPFAAFQFHPFKQGLDGLFTAKNQSFPSGDVCLAFATAECLALFFPRFRIPFYVGALLVAIARVSVNAHYLTDTIAGAGFGILAAHLAWYLCRLVFDRKTALSERLPLGSAPLPVAFER
jgi:membrane-associated phospholipid phosphatase